MEGLLSPWHLLIVLVVALLVLGPSKLPEVGRQVGRGLAELRKFRESLDEDVRGFLGHHEDEPSTSSGGELPPADAGGKPPLPEGGD
jgi:TatA/E family protein of Tat protein translocase